MSQKITDERLALLELAIAALISTHPDEQAARREFERLHAINPDAFSFFTARLGWKRLIDPVDPESAKAPTVEHA